jgi:very-short-patch-repair endonuclease
VSDFRSTVSLARELRRRQTPAEELLWSRLRSRRWQGLRIRRQEPLGGFIVDFVCLDRRVVIEVDGAVHLDPLQRERDHNREVFLRDAGFTVVRLRNEDVLADVSAVLEGLARRLGLG